MFLCLCALRRERVGQGGVVRFAQPLYAGHDPYRARKYYGTNVRKLFRETFDALERHWDSLPRTGDSAAPLVAMPEGNYTTYQWPLPLSDTTLLVLKTDYDRPSRFVRLDTRTGAEEPVCYTGLVSTRPAMYGGRVWWTEYRRSKLFEQRVNSQLCYMDLERGVARTFAGRRNALYPTPAPGELAWVEYNPTGLIRSWCSATGSPSGVSARPAIPRYTGWRGTT